MDFLVTILELLSSLDPTDGWTDVRTDGRTDPNTEKLRF